VEREKGAREGREGKGREEGEWRTHNYLFEGKAAEGWEV
jgi:hypothetical protein